MKSMHPTRIYSLTEFGNLCKRGRNRMGGMTRPEMAKRLGLTPKIINDIEIGRQSPSDGYIQEVTGLLGLNPTDVAQALAAAEDRTFSDNVIPFPRGVL